MTAIRDLMTIAIETIGADQTVREAANFMLEADTGAIPVCEDKQVIGMITDRDIAVRGVAKGYGPDCTVRELMSPDVVCAREDDDVRTVADLMSEAQVRRLPVLDDNDRLVGMVSLGDLARETSDESATDVLEGVSLSGGQHQQ